MAAIPSRSTLRRVVRAATSRIDLGLYHLDVELRSLGVRLGLRWNVHAILGVSSIALIIFLLFQEVISGHGFSALVAIEIVHLGGWAWIEVPEAVVLESEP